MMESRTLEQQEKALYCLGALAEIAPEVCALIQATSQPIELAKLSEVLYIGLQQAIQDRYRELARRPAA